MCVLHLAAYVKEEMPHVFACEGPTPIPGKEGMKGLRDEQYDTEHGYECEHDYVYDEYGYEYKCTNMNMNEELNERMNKGVSPPSQR